MPLFGRIFSGFGSLGRARVSRNGIASQIVKNLLFSLCFFFCRVQAVRDWLSCRSIIITKFFFSVECAKQVFCVCWNVVRGSVRERETSIYYWSLEQHTKKKCSNCLGRHFGKRNDHRIIRLFSSVSLFSPMTEVERLTGARVFVNTYSDFRMLDFASRLENFIGRSDSTHTHLSSELGESVEKNEMNLYGMSHMHSVWHWQMGYFARRERTRKSILWYWLS